MKNKTKLSCTIRIAKPALGYVMAKQKLDEFRG
jgi:hypothetical protein